MRRTLHLVGRDQRKRWVGLVLLAAMASGLEMLGALLVYLLVSLVADPTGALELPLIGDLRAYLDTGDDNLLLWVVIATGIFFLLRAAVAVGVNYAQYRAVFTAGARLASRLSEGYLALPYSWHLTRNTSGLIHNTNAASTQLVNEAFLPLIRVSADTLLTVGLLAVMIAVSPLATGMAIVVVGGAVLVLLRLIQPRLKYLGGVTYHMHQAAMAAMQQSLQGLRDIKILGREQHFARVYRGAADNLARAAYLRGTVFDLPRVVMELALLGFILTFFGYSLVVGTGTGEVLSVVGLFAYVGLRIQPALSSIVKGINELKFATPTIEGVEQDIRAIEGVAVSPPGPARPFDHALVAEGLAFRYEGTDEDALSEVDLTIRPGETIGICGPTGSGKTTLVDLLSGLLEPTAGRITIDGADLRDDVRGWQRNLGVVPQMVFLTDDTLRRNIALGVPDGDIDDEALADAVRLAQLEEFVARVPQGLDTLVGERGVRISGGQRQRIAIARALYGQASVLILDEGTSALDNATEAQLMVALERLRGDYTIILIAHRLSTVEDCDRIVFVDQARVAGIGGYRDLVAQNPEFRALTGGGSVV